SHRAIWRIQSRRGSNRRWMKVQWQVKASLALPRDAWIAVRTMQTANIPPGSYIVNTKGVAPPLQGKRPVKPSLRFPANT
ncbi:hypothetical protein QBK93_37510, partial [Rhizobium leguminosarum]|nr:hypothetical protein [Rhizobium leguminosarum]